MEKWGWVILLIVLALVFIRGFKVAIYDNDNENIGVEFVFSDAMVHIPNLPEFYAGSDIANKYGSIIVRRRTWESQGVSLPESTIESIPFDEVFKIEGVFTLDPVGLLQFESRSQYYIISTNNIQRTVVAKILYDIYAKNINAYE